MLRGLAKMETFAGADWSQSQRSQSSCLNAPGASQVRPGTKTEAILNEIGHRPPQFTVHTLHHSLYSVSLCSVFLLRFPFPCLHMLAWGLVSKCEKLSSSVLIKFYTERECEKSYELCAKFRSVSWLQGGGDGNFFKSDSCTCEKKCG